jgi:hypothetical protein
MLDQFQYPVSPRPQQHQYRGLPPIVHALEIVGPRCSVFGICN